MFLVGFNSKRSCLVALLWAWLLFRSLCDDVGADGDTTELGMVGAPDVEVDTVTFTTTIAYNPDSTGGGTTDANDGDTQSVNTEEPTSTPMDTGPLLSSSTTAVSVSQSSEASSKSQASSDGPKKPTRTSMSSSSPTSASTSDVPGTLTSSAIGAIVGSISGAIILSAAIFLCFRAYKRKKQQEEEHENIELDKPQDKRWHPRRLIPSAIDTTGFRRPRDFDGNDRRSVRHAQGGHDANIGVATDGSDLVPSTPALESGRRPRTGLHSRRISAASPSTPNRDSLYYKLLDEVKAGPAQPHLSNATAASSAVEWRDPQTPSTSPAGAFNFDFNRKQSGSGLVVTNPTPAARPEATLGDRAWHRRKLSTPFQPPPSGPPSVPLPPTPPERTQRSIDSVMLSSTPGSTSKPKQQSVGSRGGEEKGSLGGLGGLGLTESTEALIQPKSLYALDDPANISTIALGPSPAPTPPPKDDLLTLPSTRYEGPKDVGDRKGKGKEVKSSEVQEAQSPTLPRISQGGKLGAGPWTSMMHTVGVGDREMAGKQEVKEEKQEQGKGKGKEIEKRPESSSTIGTSILFPSEDES
ncbi:hypothetical protein F4805DRAFT_214321 [Annulohypoxylon moriforme]|nr:hypothetical protein F4805DRAFT_214321 [Annulohypoxylon moriforme]